MQRSLLSSVIQTAGFALIGFLFFVWYLGHQKNNPAALEISPKTGDIAQAEARIPSNADEKESAYLESPSRPRSYSNQSIQAPEPVTRSAESYNSRSSSVDRASLSPSNSRSGAAAAVQSATTIRSWKGVHRDESFAWLCFERFGQEVVALSKEHGLYPDIFLSRIIAYSYDYTKDPRVSPADNNVPALAHPKSDERALFRSAEESLKAYAVLHAGEVNRLSHEGAIGKNDRAWTMRKIIDGYPFVSNLAADLADRDAYRGRVGKANKASEQENYQREMVGEAIKMVSGVDDIVKKRRAESAGYSNWEDYLDDLTDEERAQQEEEASAKTSAISKKKAFNLSRRVNAKQRKDD